MSLCNKSYFSRDRLSLRRQTHFYIQDNALSFDKYEISHFFLQTAIDILYTESEIYSFRPDDE
jgi:hypothetical protein